MKLMADVIDRAIDKYLWDGQGDFCEGDKEIASCWAIDAADKSGATQIKKFLRSMDSDPKSTKAFSSFPYGPKRQYARALWLTWAAMIAREEGKTL